MKKTLLVLLCGVCVHAFSQTIIYQDDFEAFNDMETVPGQNDFWEAWSCNDYGPESVYISEEQAASGSKSIKLEVENGSDIVLDIGENTTGAYTVSWKMLIPDSREGYVAFFHSWGCNGSNASYGAEMVFNEFGVNIGQLSFANAFSFDTWFDISVEIDLEAFTYTLTIDDAQVYQGFWSAGIGSNTFQAVNFSSLVPDSPGILPNGVSAAQYFIDDVLVTRENQVGIADQEMLEMNIFPNPANSSTQINGLVPGSFIRVIDLAGKAVFESTAISSVVDVNTSSLSEGIYIVQVNNQAQTLTRKLVVSR